MPTPDAVEPHVVEDFILESGPFTGDRRILAAVPAEHRIFVVDQEQRVFLVPTEQRIFPVEVGW